MMIRSVAMAMSLALAAAGCSDHRAPTAPTSGDPSRVVVSMDAPAMLVQGQDVEITVWMTNPEALPVTLNFSSGCILVFTVKDGTGMLVGPEPRPCTDNTPVVELAPGGQLAVTFQWSGKGQDFEFLAPGTYSLVGSVTAHETQKTTAPMSLQILPQ